MYKIKSLILSVLIFCLILSVPAYSGAERITYYSYYGAEEAYTDYIPCDTSLIKIYPGFNPKECFNLFDSYVEDSSSVVADVHIYFEENAICIKPEKPLQSGVHKVTVNYNDGAGKTKDCENYFFSVWGYVFGKQREVNYYMRENFSGITYDSVDCSLKLMDVGNYAEISKTQGPAGSGDAALLFEFSNEGEKEKNGPYLGLSNINWRGRVVIEHDIKFNTTCDNLNYEFKGVGNSSSLFHFVANKQQLFGNNGFFQDTQIPYNDNTWSRVKIIGDFDTCVWDMYYNGVEIYKNIPMENSTIEGIGIFKIYLGQSGSANEKFQRAGIAIDNLNVYSEKTESDIEVNEFSILSPTGNVSGSVAKLQIGAPDAQKVEFYLDGEPIKEFEGGEKIYTHNVSTQNWTYGKKEFKAVILKADGSRQSKKINFDFKNYALKTTFNAMFGASDNVGFASTTGMGSIIKREDNDYAYEMSGNGFITRGLSLAGSGGGHGLIIFDIDMKFYSTEDAADLEFKIVKSDGSNAFFVPICSKVFGGAEGGATIAGTNKTYEADKWYNVRVILDFENLVQSLYFDNELITSIPIDSMAENYQYFSNFKVNVYDIGTEVKPGVAIDNVKISKATVAPEFTASCDGVLIKNDVIYQNASDLSIEFDREIAITPASHVTVKVDGSAVQLPEITYNGKVLSISLENMNLRKNSTLDVEIKSDVLIDGEKLDRNMSRRFYVGDNDGFYVGKTDVEINGNVVSALVDYINSTGKEKPLYLLISTYNADKTRTYDINISEYKNASLGFGSMENHISVDAEAKNAGAFLWKTTLEPVCTNTEINVNAK